MTVITVTLAAYAHQVITSWLHDDVGLLPGDLVIQAMPIGIMLLRKKVLAHKAFYMD